MEISNSILLHAVGSCAGAPILGLGPVRSLVVGGASYLAGRTVSSLAHNNLGGFSQKIDAWMKSAVKESEIQEDTNGKEQVKSTFTPIDFSNLQKFTFAMDCALSVIAFFASHYLLSKAFNRCGMMSSLVHASIQLIATAAFAAVTAGGTQAVNKMSNRQATWGITSEDRQNVTNVWNHQVRHALGTLVPALGFVA